MEGFNFHILSRKDLQALCKLNKIPANITNVAMADSLQALHQVEGLDDLLQLLDSDPPLPGTPVIPPSACRSSVRRNTSNVVEPETSKPLTRTRRTTKKTGVAGGCPPETPAATAVSRRKVSVVESSKFSLEAEGSSVQNVCSTRRSVRLLGKSMAKMCFKETEQIQVLAEADSLTAPNETSEQPKNSCQNLDSLLENESEIKDEVSTDNANDELNVSESVERNSLTEVPSLEYEVGNDKETSDELNLPKADDTEISAVTVDHGSQDVTEEHMVEMSNEDGEYQVLDSSAEMETGSYEWQQNDSSVETLDEWSLVVPEAIGESGPQVSEDSSAYSEEVEQVVAVQKEEPDGKKESEVTVSSFAANQLQGQFPRPTTEESSMVVDKENIASNCRMKICEDDNEESEKEDEEVEMKKTKKEKKGLDELSVRQLSKMLKEQLQLKAEKKNTEKRQAMQILLA